jgi:hypothetical protein
MAMANFTRDKVGDAVRYQIAPLSLMGWRSWTLIGTVLFASVIGGIVWVILWAFNLYTGLIGFLALTAAVAYLMHRRAAKGFGTREESRVTLTDDLVKVERGKSNHNIKRAGVRRLRYSNTAAQFAPVAYDDAAHGQIASETHAKVEKSCWSVLLDYDNSSVVIADGLDGVTCQNLLEDLNQDLFSRKV